MTITVGTGPHMTDANDRGTFSCRIDGRAGYLRLYDDRIDLVRVGRRGSRALGPVSIPLTTVTRVSTGKAGRLLTVVEVFAAGIRVELKLPSVDAGSVRDLLSSLVRQARPVSAPSPVAAAAQRAVAAAASGAIAQIAAVPIAAVPIAAVPIAAVPIAAVPIAAVPIAAVPIAAVPIAAVPIAAVPIASPRPPLDSWPSLPTAPAAHVTPDSGAPVPDVSFEIITAPAVPEARAAAPRLVAGPRLAPVPAQQLPPDVEQRMERLAVLHFAGILSDQEYEVRRAELLAEA